MCKNADEVYMEILKQAGAEVCSNNFENHQVFAHCIKTCNQLFAVAEFHYGKAANNLNTRYLQAMGRVYDSILEHDYLRKTILYVYDYQTSAKHFPNMKYSLESMLENKYGDEFYESEKNKLFTIKNKFLNRFFGYDYRINDPPDVKYEMLRLVKILYDCNRNFPDVSLTCLMHDSIVRFHPNIESKYKKAIEFIKERIVMRRSDSGCRLPFEIIMEIERYNNSVHSFLNSCMIESVNYILSHVPQHPNTNCHITRLACTKIFNLIIRQLDSIKLPPIKKVNEINAIQCYAYEHFISMDLRTELYTLEDMAFKDSKEITFDLDEMTYFQIDELSLKDTNPTISNMESLVNHFGKDGGELCSIIYNCFPEEERVSVKIYGKRLRRHIPHYEILWRLYVKEFNRNDGNYFSVREGIILICLYEILVEKKISIPLYSGYQPDSPRKLKIDALLKQLCNIFDKDTESSLTDEEYFIACYWLREKIFMLMNYRTNEIQQLMREAKKKLLSFWKQNVPVLQNNSNTDDLIYPLDKLVEKILPREKLQTILNDALLEYEMRTKSILLEIE